MHLSKTERKRILRVARAALRWRNYIVVPPSPGYMMREFLEIELQRHCERLMISQSLYYGGRTPE